MISKVFIPLPENYQCKDEFEGIQIFKLKILCWQLIFMYIYIYICLFKDILRK